MAMRFRAAIAQDLAAIEQLLAGASLPTSGVSEQLSAFVVAEVVAESISDAAGESTASKENVVVGVGGLETHSRFTLLRSVVVAPGYRGRGIASAICNWLEQEAARRGCGHVFLLTETAESFFLRRGYVVVARADAPTEIAATVEFTTLCPESAILMAKEL
jgi:amino-acid N-acetyltransferase